MKNLKLKIEYKEKYKLTNNTIIISGDNFGDFFLSYLIYLILKKYIINIYFNINNFNINNFHAENLINHKEDEHIFLGDISDKIFFNIIKFKYNNEQGNKNNILEMFFNEFFQQFNIPNDICDKIRQEIKTTKYKIPVKYYDILSIPSVDVSIVSKGGLWSGYKNWPYFKELKDKLNENKITYIDLSEKNIKNIECLNYIKKSKLYLGLDTGVSHYASSVASGKTLIIQSGYNYFDFWCFYDYDYINVNIECQKCFLNYYTITKKHKYMNCKNDHKCMKNISVDMVYNKIVEKLKK